MFAHHIRIQCMWGESRALDRETASSQDVWWAPPVWRLLWGHVLQCHACGCCLQFLPGTTRLQPKVPVREGLRKTIEYFRKELQEVIAWDHVPYSISTWICWHLCMSYLCECISWACCFAECVHKHQKRTWACHGSDLLMHLFQQTRVFLDYYGTIQLLSDHHLNA